MSDGEKWKQNWAQVINVTHKDCLSFFDIQGSFFIALMFDY